MKIRPMGAELFHVEGWTERWTTYMTETILTFLNFANAFKN
jgi:hypothetical protein